MFRKMNRHGFADFITVFYSFCFQKDRTLSSTKKIDVILELQPINCFMFFLLHKKNNLTGDEWHAQLRARMRLYVFPHERSFNPFVTCFAKSHMFLFELN